MSASDDEQPPAPKRSIRRFDIFAEYNRIKKEQDGLPPDQAKGYGIWVAKVVASGRTGVRRLARAGPAGPPGGRPGGPDGERGAAGEHEPAAQPPEPKFRDLGGEPQTDVLFDREIIARMGEDFYASVFSPAVAQAVREGKSYEAIRDSLRAQWKPRPGGR